LPRLDFSLLACMAVLAELSCACLGFTGIMKPHALAVSLSDVDLSAQGPILCLQPYT
jgi:hypothetical protein